MKWWDWGTTHAQQKKGWSMSAAQQMLSRIEHVYAHAEAMSARTMRLSSQGRGSARDELRALTEVQPAQPFSEVRAARKELETSLMQRRMLMNDDGETRGDIRLPDRDSPDRTLGDKLAKLLAEGQEVNVTVTAAMGMCAITAFKVTTEQE